jgi:ubiquitin carboxyl-terminal hydrolase L5
MGVSGTQVEEIWSLDDDTLKGLKPSYGIIFLFKWQGSEPSAPYPESTGANDHIFFAKQVISNACATQAILSILLNSENVRLGDELSELKKFTAEFPSDMKGLAISNSEVIRSVHNSFARSDPFVSDGRDSREDDKDDLFHFVSYVPIHGALWELDGLSNGPVNLGPCTDDDWLERVRPIIQARMARYASSEIRFNLMAIIRDRQEVYKEQIDAVDAKLASIDDTQELERLKMVEERELLEHQIEIEKEKLKRHKSENVLRKHNFIPLIYNFLRILAEKNQLAPLVSEAKLKRRKDAEKDSKKG